MRGAVHLWAHYVPNSLKPMALPVQLPLEELVRGHLDFPSGVLSLSILTLNWSMASVFPQLRAEALFFPGNREIFQENREAIEHERAITERD